VVLVGSSSPVNDASSSAAACADAAQNAGKKGRCCGCSCTKYVNIKEPQNEAHRFTTAQTKRRELAFWDQLKYKRKSKKKKRKKKKFFF
jgi:hypothetical protein